MGYGQPLLIRVIDNGKGIPVEEIDKIFLPFYTSGKATGTGLGLSLVRKWVVYQSGEITCQSTLNRGTTFTITLPQRPASAVAVKCSGEALTART